VFSKQGTIFVFLFTGHFKIAHLKKVRAHNRHWFLFVSPLLLGNLVNLVGLKRKQQLSFCVVSLANFLAAIEHDGFWAGIKNFNESASVIVNVY